MPQPNRHPPSPPKSSLCMVDEARFKKVRRTFKDRGMDGLSLVAMMRIVVDEWIRTERGKCKD